MSVIETETVEESLTWVDNGIQWMDDNFPGWWNAINLETFDLNNYQYCVLGQVTPLFKSWITWFEEMGGGWMKIHGFAGTDGMQERWISAIEERQESDVL